MPNCLLVATDDAQKVIRRLDTNGNSTIIAGQVEFDEPDPNDAGTRPAGAAGGQKSSKQSAIIVAPHLLAQKVKQHVD